MLSEDSLQRKSKPLYNPKTPSAMKRPLIKQFIENTNKDYSIKSIKTTLHKQDEFWFL